MDFKEKPRIRIRVIPNGVHTADVWGERKTNHAGWVFGCHRVAGVRVDLDTAVREVFTYMSKEYGLQA